MTIPLCKENLSKFYITSEIAINAKLNAKKIRLFNFIGLEIIDDSDLIYYNYPKERNRIIFFTFHNENFQNKDIMKVFNLQTKIGEVNI
jgi:hypothetical protein